MEVKSSLYYITPASASKKKTLLTLIKYYVISVKNQTSHETIINVGIRVREKIKGLSVLIIDLTYKFEFSYSKTSYSYCIGHWKCGFVSWKMEHFQLWEHVHQHWDWGKTNSISKMPEVRGYKINYFLSSKLIIDHFDSQSYRFNYGFFLYSSNMDVKRHHFF